MDRPPEDPAPADSTPEEPEPAEPTPAAPPDAPAPSTDEPSPSPDLSSPDLPTESFESAAPDQPTSPYGPASPGATASPYGPGPGVSAPSGAEEPTPPYAVPPIPPATYSQPGAYAPPPGVAGSAPPGPGPAPKDGRAGPGAGAGVATGCGLQVLAFILFSVTGGLMFGFLGALWPFILVTIGSALLMLSRRWRRFATGALIVCVATWIVVIGPCIALLSGSF